MSSIEQNDVPEGAGEGGLDSAEFSAAGRFPPVLKKLEETGHTAFDNPLEYYKAVMAEGKETSARLHTVFQKYTQAKDPKDKTVFRLQMLTPFWDHLAALARTSVSAPSLPKKYLLRFAILHPSLINAEMRAFFSKVVDKSFQEISVYYLDEWVRYVGTGQIRASTTDEAPAKRADPSARLSALADKAAGKIEGDKGLLLEKNEIRARLEEDFLSMTKSALVGEPHQTLPQVSAPYTEEQKHNLTEAQEIIKSLLKVDREMFQLFKDMEDAAEELRAARSKLGEEQAASPAAGEEAIPTGVDTAAIDTEFGSIRQMAKMTIGRQGNAFPILITDFYRCQPQTAGTKENVLALLSWIESIDCEAYHRMYKGKASRIVPYVILLPTYGDFGICWEPYDKRNKATSKGRIAIPMYPKNLTVAVLTAVADFRWQVAKETASYYWMEEGLTGNYYQWFQAQKLKGDVKMFFMQDYIMWITKESEGTQKLPKEVRNTFWRYLPFPQSLKDRLKDRNLIYQDLYQKDLNRAKSDGY